MLSNNITKSQFILQALDRDLANIYAAQRLIAEENKIIRVRKTGEKFARKSDRRDGIGVKTGRLINSLQSPDYIVSQQGEKFVVSASIVLHMRFLDMKKYGNWRIYNAQVWGILYNNALRDIRWNYGYILHDAIGDLLREAFGKTSDVTKFSELIEWARKTGIGPYANGRDPDSL